MPVNNNLNCSVKCACFLCRELQSCRSDGRKNKKTDRNMCDNFILRKAEAFETSSAMKFIRGAARLSVRHWQNKENSYVTSRPFRQSSKSTSFEQLYPLKSDERVNMYRAPSFERVSRTPEYEYKPIFKILSNPKLKNESGHKNKKSVLNFKRSDLFKDRKNIHEKYVPVPYQAPSFISDPIYSEPKQRNSHDYSYNQPPPAYHKMDKFMAKDFKPVSKNANNTEDKVYPERRSVDDATHVYNCTEDNKRKELLKNNISQGSNEQQRGGNVSQCNNKVVIYFGDSIVRKPSKTEIVAPLSKDNDNHIYVNKLLEETSNLGLGHDKRRSETNLVSEIDIKGEDIYSEITESLEVTVDKIEKINIIANQEVNVNDPVIENGVMKVSFKENYECARKLINIICAKEDNDEANILNDDRENPIDWSFIQNWRKRPSNVNREPEEMGRHAKIVPALACSTPAPPILQPNRATKVKLASHHQTMERHEQIDCSPQIKCVTTPTKITVLSTPVKSQNPMSSYTLERSGSTNPTSPSNSHHQIEVSKDIINNIPNGISRECNSSSDENRSSGHASMSDSGGGGGVRGVPVDCEGSSKTNRSRASSHHSRSRHRPQPAKLQSPWPGGGGLEDIRCAIKQLTLRSRDSGSGNSSASLASHTQASVSSGDRRRRAPLARQPSLDTVCTNVTSADEFVWVDSHNRLVELQHVPWSPTDLQAAISLGRCKDNSNKVSPDTIPRLAYMLQRALVRIARETQRLSHNFGVCTKNEVGGAFRIVLSTPLAEACLKSCQRAATMFAMSAEAGLRQSKSIRASTNLSVGKFQRWMVDTRIAPFVHEYAAVYLCAGMEALLEEIVFCCLKSETDESVTLIKLDRAVANSADLWGLLQPYAHLNAGRLASGALSLTRWTSLTSIGSGGDIKSLEHAQPNGHGKDSGIIVNSSGGTGSMGSSKSTSGASTTSSGSVLLTTCVGSSIELRDLLKRIVPLSPTPSVTSSPGASTSNAVPLLPLSPDAEDALFYFMRCSQLEHSGIPGASGSNGSGAGGGNTWWKAPEGGALWAGRGAGRGALPPLAEWLRVACAHAGHRAATHVDKDDILQAARLLLPGVDCPPRSIEDIIPSVPRTELARSFTDLAAHRLLSYGNADLIAAARALLPSAGLDTPDANGLTALMKAALAGDEKTVSMLVDAGADPNIETQCTANGYGATTGGWTALVYASARGRSGVVARLLSARAHPDAAAAKNHDVAALTPLQVACGAGDADLVRRLLSGGAQAFVATGVAGGVRGARGCGAAVAVAAAHGRIGALHALLAAPPRDSLSLEDILAEGATAAHHHSQNNYTKSQLRALQEAMYHAAETDRLDVTLELRGAGVPWSLHAWMSSLAAAHNRHADTVIDTLLQDFLQVCPTDDSHYSKAFIYECLPLLFSIFRTCKKEGTVLLLADTLCTVYGWEPVPLPRDPPPHPPAAHRVHPAFVNNPDLSDVTFRVEGRLFYGHKIVLVSESARLRSMLAAPASTETPVVQIDDIRYHIFQHVMKYLYSGGCYDLEIPECDVLEVLAAASFFQLLPLQRHCEARAAKTVDLHNLNMVALLTYDDSAKRLLLGSRLPSHDALGALLKTLQQRVEQRKRNKTQAR